MPAVEAALGPLIGDIKARDPSLLTAFHLVGSVVLDDFQPHASDIDFVAVLSRRPNASDLELLATVHKTYAEQPGRPLLDGIWVTEPDLVAGPDRLPDGPVTHDNHFTSAGQGERNPVVWATLRDCSQPVLGTLNRATLWRDDASLRHWLRHNADTYWRGWHSRSCNLLSRPGVAMLGPRAPMWGVLGISRQHYTLATGMITSKSGAGRYARDAFGPQWHRIIDECLAIRSGARPSGYSNPFARRRDALDFMAATIEAVVNYPH